jgi:hypothetical protein
VESIELKVAKNKNKFDVNDVHEQLKLLDELVYTAYGIPQQIARSITKDQEAIELT